MSTLFGKPRGDVVKHPGLFKAKAEKAGKSTAEFAQEHEHSKGKIGEEARLAETFAGMRRKKYYGE